MYQFLVLISIDVANKPPCLKTTWDLLTSAYTVTLYVTFSMDMYAAYKLATVMVNNPNTRPATTTPATQEGAYDCPYYAIEVIIIIKIHFNSVNQIQQT